MNCPQCDKRLGDLPKPIYCSCGFVVGGPEPTSSYARRTEEPRKPRIPIPDLETNAITCRRNNCGKYLEELDACKYLVDMGRLGKVSFLDGKPSIECPHDPPQWVAEEDSFPTLAAPWVTEVRLLQDAEILLDKLASLEIARIVGVPRSGMIPASFLATRLGVHLASLTTEGIAELSSGLRYRNTQQPEGLTIVVEDSSASGWSINEIKAKLGQENIKYAAVYVTPSASKRLDFYGRILPLPHWFSWNIFGNDRLLEGFNIATDFDGVLCPDCPAEMDDNGERYVQWMASTRCKIRTHTNTIPFIITARLEKYRAETEKWLARNKVAYGKLVMGPWATQAERHNNCIGTWKRRMAETVGARMFIESDDHQARIISTGWEPPVVCTDSQTCYVNGVGPQWRLRSDRPAW